MKSNSDTGKVKAAGKAAKVRLPAVPPAVPAADPLPPMTRKYNKDKTRCRVTFRLPKQAAPDATTVVVVGSFSDWSLDRHPMKHLKKGGFSLEIDLEAGKEYEFRFLVDGARWENAWNADKYVWSRHSHSDNSVVVI